MLLPSTEQYAEIIEEKDAARFSLLNDYTFLCKQNGQQKHYCFSVGTCAAVFKAVKNKEPYAIRCFLRGELETFKRYEQLQAFLQAKHLPWKVDFEFLDNAINVGGHWYPVVKMDWVEGKPLNIFIDEAASNPSLLSLLQKKLAALSANLEENNIGHGDLKYNNIFIQKDGDDFTLKLIDYDSMFIPAFQGKKNLEPGSPGFQHPKRLSTAFSNTIDRFSIWVMLTTLEALKIDAHLWKEAEQVQYTNSENSLFTVSDFIHPATSKTFQKLKGYKNRSLDFYVDKLMEACRSQNVDAIPKPEVQKLVAGSLHEVKKYEADFIPTPDHIELQPVFEQDEIIEFSAGNYRVQEGQRTTLHWKVKGEGKIHISNVGDIYEKSGSRKIVVSNTTNYTLTVGAKNKLLTIHVQPKPVIPKLVRKETASAKTVIPHSTTKAIAIKAKRRLLRPALLLVLLAATSFYVVRYISKNKTAAISSAVTLATPPSKPAFTQAGVASFLKQLYSAYNSRDLSSIMNHYAPSLNEYYDLQSLTKDSLGTVINNLFILPAYYQCAPDFETLSIQPQRNNCKAVITIKERVKSGKKTKTNTYTTTVAYLLDSSYKIVSEKAVE